MNGIDARVLTISPGRPLRAFATTFGALVGSGFRRYATYRQATIAGTCTNIVFGFLRCYVLLAVAGGRGAAGYDTRQLVTYVWAGQGLLAVVNLWGNGELAERIRTGDVAADLLRPVAPVTAYLAADLGRAGHAMLTRFVPPVVVGLLVFGLAKPTYPQTLPLFLVSTLTAVVCGCAAQFMVNACAYWLHDARGPLSLWALASGVLTGLYFPIRLFPDWLAAGLYFATPFPSMLQVPLDVLAERDGPAQQAGLVLLQVAWAAALLALANWVQHRAERRLVVQGG